MIHILQGHSLADRRMATMFADRKRLFVDLKGHISASSDGAEYRVRLSVARPLRLRMA